MESVHVTEIVLLGERRDAAGKVTGHVHRIIRSDSPSLPGILKSMVKLAEQYFFYSEGPLPRPPEKE